MVFLEELPDQCPPAKAQSASIEGAYRVVFAKPPTIKDFWSHSKLGKKRYGDVTECRWRSCSMFLTRDKALNIASKLPKSRAAKPYLALVNLSPNDGMTLINDKTAHVDVWLTEQFSIDVAVIDTEVAPI